MEIPRWWVNLSTLSSFDCRLDQMQKTLNYCLANEGLKFLNPQLKKKNGMWPLKSPWNIFPMPSSDHKGQSLRKILLVTRIWGGHLSRTRNSHLNERRESLHLLANRICLCAMGNDHCVWFSPFQMGFFNCNSLSLYVSVGGGVKCIR